MHLRPIVLMLSLSTLALGLLLGCDSGPTTTTAPTGHDGSTHGPTSAPTAPDAAKQVGPRR